MSFFSMLSDLFDSEEYRRDPIPQDLPPDRFAAISIGAINAEQTGYFCDSLRTGSDVEEIKDNLSSYYDIEDRDTALETLEWLYTSGHRVYFDNIKGILSGRGAPIAVTGMDAETAERIREYSSNLQESIEELVEEKFLKQRADLARCSILAWDMGRLVLVARCCFDAGYISEEEAWRYILDARQASQGQYTSWEEFAAGYVIGRAMWSGSGMSLMGIISIAQGLLEDEESPWKRCDL